MFTSVPGMFIPDIQGLVLNVLDFGVNPANTGAQNSTGIAAALASVSSGNPVTLLFPCVGSGAYTIASTIFIDQDKVTLLGLGTRSGAPSIFVASDLSYAIVVGKTKNVNDCLIQGLTLVGLNSTTSTGGGINFRCSGGAIKQTKVSNFGGTGINVAAFSGNIFEVLLEDVKLQQNGMNTGTPGDNLVLASSISDCEYIRVISSGNTAKNTTQNGFNVSGGNQKFIQCHAYFCSNAGLINNAGNTQVIGGEWETNGLYGIESNGSGPLIVTGATIGNNGSAGVAIFNAGSARVTVSDCMFAANTFQDVFSNSSGTGVISGNTCTGTIQAIGFGAGADGYVISDNILNATTSTVISMAGTHCAIHDNLLPSGNIVEVTGANNNDIHDNILESGSVTIVGASTIVRNNPGYNPIGQVSAPSFPNTTVAATNQSGFDVTVFVANGAGAITQIQIAGAGGSYVNTNMQIGASSWGSFRLPAGASVKFTYGSGSPAWTWFGD